MKAYKITGNTAPNVTTPKGKISYKLNQTKIDYRIGDTPLIVPLNFLYSLDCSDLIFTYKI